MLDKIRFLYSVWFFEDSTLLITYAVLTLLLTLACVLSYRYRNGGIFFSSLAIFLGGALLLFTAYGKPLERAFPLFALLSVTVGVAYLIYMLCARLTELKKRKKDARERQAREMRYTLPQKDNTFIRERLNNAFTEENEQATDLQGEEIKLRFTYAKGLLEKLRLQSLSVTERLETDELANVFAVYMKKETYVGEDVRLISEAFSRVLKLAAKYGV